MSLTTAEIAQHIGGELSGSGDTAITGVAKIEEAGESQITFIANRKYLKHLSESKAGAVIVHKDVEDVVGPVLIRVDDPYFAFMKTVILFHPPEPLIDEGIHDTAVIGESTQLGESLAVGAHVTIGRRCKIGDNSVLMPGVVIADDVHIGNNCLIHANVSIREKVVIGDRVIIQDGAVIGSDGFGFAPHQGAYHKIPQVGTVVIEDDVEIGANTTIDRATMGETRIKKGTKLDNLIQVAHNCTIGEHTVSAAQTGLSGSTHIGSHVRIGGQVGFAGHLKVGDNVAIGAQSGVHRDVPPDSNIFGTPAVPMKEAFKISAAQRHLPQMLKDIKELKKKIEDLDKS